MHFFKLVKWNLGTSIFSFLSRYFVGPIFEPFTIFWSKLNLLYSVYVYHINSSIPFFFQNSEYFSKKTSILWYFMELYFVCLLNFISAWLRNLFDITIYLSFSNCFYAYMIHTRNSFSLRNLLWSLASTLGRNLYYLIQIGNYKLSSQSTINVVTI